MRKSPFGTKYKRALGPSPSQAYVTARSDPFHPAAEGCRVPDEYGFPTASYHLKAEGTLVSTTAGSGSFLFYPNPIICIQDAFGGTSGATLSGGINASTAGAYGMLLPSQLSGSLTDFRVVSWGVRFSCALSPMNAVGVIDIASVPTSETPAGYNAINSTNPLPSYLIPNLTNGVNISSNMIAGVLNFPDADRCAISEIIDKELVVVGKTCSPSWLNFKSTENNNALSATIQEVVSGEYYNATGNIAVNNYYTNIASGAGYAAICVNFSGVPVSSTILNFEIIFHIEGTPALSTVGLASSGARPLIVIDPGVVHKVEAEANRRSVFSIVKSGLYRFGPPALTAIGSGFRDGVRQRNRASKQQGIPRKLAYALANLAGGRLKDNRSAQDMAKLVKMLKSK